MKDIALAILEGNGRVDVLTEAVLLSVLGKGGDFACVYFELALVV